MDKENKPATVAVEILQDFKGSPDGFNVIEYTKGDKLDMVKDLADVAVKEKWARPQKALSAAEKKAADEHAAKVKSLQDKIALLTDQLADAPADVTEEQKKQLQDDIAAAQEELDKLLA